MARCNTVPAHKVDMSGKTFGRLTVVAQDGNTPTGQAKWLCTCECGRQVSIRGAAIRYGHTKSCGCLKDEKARQRVLKHGMSKTKAFRIWCHIIERCHAEKGHERYAGRGIIVCERWKSSFENFLEDMGHPQEGQSIDRIDNDGNYEPGNCRWTDWFTQANNRRNSIRVSHNGETRTIAEWSRHTGIPYMTLYHRIFSYGWGHDKALTEPVNQNKRRVKP